MKPRFDMLAHGVNIITAQHEGRRGGMTAAWATQVALDHILVCIGSQSATRELILASGAFGVNKLAVENLEIARLFGSSSSRDTDKFAGLGLHTAVTGSPLLDDCAIAIDCQVVAVHDFKDEKLIIGKVAAVEYLRAGYQALVYREEDY